MRMYVCVYVCVLSVSTSLYMAICMYICVYICILYVCKCVFVCMCTCKLRGGSETGVRTPRTTSRANEETLCRSLSRTRTLSLFPIPSSVNAYAQNHAVKILAEMRVPWLK